MPTYFTNFSCPLTDDPMPSSGSQGSAGRTGSLGHIASIDGPWAQGQMQIAGIFPNQKPGSRGSFNGGMN